MIRLVTKRFENSITLKGVQENEVKEDVGIIVFNGFNACRSCM